jgi:hypothetical protein
MGKPSQIDHILIDRQRNSSALDVQSLKTADFDNDYYQLVIKVRKNQQ